MAIGFGISTLDAKYDQTATLLRQGYASDAPTTNDEETHGDLGGHYEFSTHPITGEVIRVWREVTIPDDPETGFDERQVFEFKCQARPVITGGLNSQGTAERWTTKGSYENVDFVELFIPKGIIITKRDRVTNIKDSRGRVVWVEEEHGSFEPTVFDVRGVAPSLDPFGSVVEYFALLERSEIQGGRET